MIKHIQSQYHKHKLGIKQASLAFAFLLVVSGALFLTLKPNLSTEAKEGYIPDYATSEYDFPSTEATQQNDSSSGSVSKKVSNAKYGTKPKNLPIYLVKMVIDGNTILVEGDRRIRLIGIKSPDKDEELGLEATDFLRDIVSGKQVFFQEDSENPKDDLGRLRGIIYIDQRNINIEILRAGFAHSFITTPSVVKYRDWSAFEDEAREAKKGLWAEEKSKEKETESRDTLGTTKISS
jgi:micrococcal nuclease